MTVSIVIRTYNEERHLGDVLSAIGSQQCEKKWEVVLVDSGSTDSTTDIARSHGCRIVTIAKQDFTFGRSLNVGCEAANGDILVFLSGHCIPTDRQWLARLIEPVRTGKASYCYGRQIGGASSRFSECQIFLKYYPQSSAVPQAGFFCNNANAAIDRATWEKTRFDEALTGLEDMALAKLLSERGISIGYVADATVTHLHDESWRAVKNRFEREAIALQGIMPQVHVTFGDFVRYFTSAVLIDFGAALQERVIHRKACEIVAYRFMQFLGSYRGNNEHRKLSREMKDRYFYPR